MSADFESGLFTNGQKAWHGLGTVLPNKVYDTLEAIELSGLDWTVNKRPVLFTESDDSTEILNTDYFVLVRDKDQTVLNVVGSRYEPLQNTEVFTFFDPFLHERECFISSAISLNRGRKICLCLQIEDNIREVVNGDMVTSYLILATSHDGSIATTLKYTNIRVVCQNTLTAALAAHSTEDTIRTVRHTKNQISKLEQIRRTVDIYRTRFNQDINLYQEMARRPMSIDAFRSYLEKVFEPTLNQAKKNTKEGAKEFTLDTFKPTERCLCHFLTCEDLQTKGVEMTAWAGFNAITRFVSHEQGKSQDRRVESFLFGNGAKLLDRAKELALR